MKKQFLQLAITTSKEKVNLWKKEEEEDNTLPSLSIDDVIHFILKDDSGNNIAMLSVVPMQKGIYQIVESNIKIKNLLSVKSDPLTTCFITALPPQIWRAIYKIINTLLAGRNDVSNNLITQVKEKVGDAVKRSGFKEVGRVKF